jgi:hypothetical protein
MPGMQVSGSASRVDSSSLADLTLTLVVLSLCAQLPGHQSSIMRLHYAYASAPGAGLKVRQASDMTQDIPIAKSSAKTVTRLLYHAQWQVHT